jgi:hypothetical protein
LRGAWADPAPAEPASPAPITTASVRATPRTRETLRGAC